MLYSMLHQLDITAFYLVNHLPHNGALNAFATAMHYGTRGGIIYLPLLIILVIQKKYRQSALLILSAGTLTILVVDLILKPLIHRARPFSMLANVALLPAVPHTWSFPSAEAALAFSIAAMCTLVLSGKKWVLIWAWAVLVGLDRIYMGHHYPSDVIAGAAIGIIVSYVIFKLTQTWRLRVAIRNARL